LIGFLMLRNFSVPLGRLVAVIKEVSDGRFPDFRETENRDEIGYLWNQFAEMVRNLRDKQEELAAVHQQLEKQAVTDALTGLYNRHYLYDIYPKLWSEALRQNGGLSVILIDLDHFKSINDRFGHPTGDRVLVHMVNVLRESCRVSDFLFRMGGEEFIVLTRACLEGAQVLAEKIREALERSPINEAEETDGLNGLTQMLARADKALYTAKQAGRNRVARWEAPRLIVSKR
jgi:diguanylate cyclase (GGDEF)-like protein